MRTEKLGNLAEFRNGLNYTDADNGAGLAVVGVSDFKDKVVIDTGNLPQLSLSALSKPDALIQQGDILFVRSNGNRELIGRSVYVKTEPAMPTSHSGFTIRCRFHDHRCYPRYYAYLFRGPIIRQTLSAQGGGTNISNLNQQILAELDVPVPELSIQRRTADFLSTYDDLIEVNQRRIMILEEMARRLFNEWFVRLRYPGYEDAPLVETETGSVRQECQDVTLHELAEISGRSIQPQDHPQSSFLHYSLPNFDNEQTATLDPAVEIKSTKISIQDGTVLLSKLNPRIPRIWPVTEQSQVPMVCSTEFIPLRARGGYLFTLRELLLSDLFRGFLTGLAAGTSTSHQRVRPAEVLQFKFTPPPGEAVAKLEQQLRPLNTTAIIAREQNRKLRAARELLLPKLLSGEISLERVEDAFEEAAE